VCCFIQVLRGSVLVVGLAPRGLRFPGAGVHSVNLYRRPYGICSILRGRWLKCAVYLDNAGEGVMGLLSVLPSSINPFTSVCILIKNSWEIVSNASSSYKLMWGIPAQRIYDRTFENFEENQVSIFLAKSLEFLCIFLNVPSKWEEEHL